MILAAAMMAKWAFGFRSAPATTHAKLYRAPRDFASHIGLEPTDVVPARKSETQSLAA